MTPPGIASTINTTWPTAVGGNRYPFTDAAAMTSNQAVKLPAGFISDAVVYSRFGAARLYISKIEITSSTIKLVLSGDNAELATGSAALHSTQLELFDKYQRPAGVIIFGQAGEASSVLTGTHTFPPEALPFTSSCVVPIKDERLEGILLDDGSFFAGDVWMIGRRGVVLEVLTPPAGTEIHVHVVGDPLYRRRVCTDENQPFIPTPSLRKVKFVLLDTANEEVDLVPDRFGNSVITTGSAEAADNVLRINIIDHGLMLSAIGNTVPTQQAVTGDT